MKSPKSNVLFPTNKEEAVTYTKEILAEGIVFWLKIIVLVSLTSAALRADDIISDSFFWIVILHPIGCLVVMILGASLACLEHLAPRECYRIVRNHLKNSCKRRKEYEEGSR